MLTNTTEIGTATLPRRRLTIPAPTDVSPSAPRRPPRFPALAWAALALLGLLAHPSPAAAQTDVWTATLTPADFGSGLLGCNNASATSKCSTATVLSDDDFTYDSTDYSVTTLYLNATAFTFTVDTDITAATNALTVVVGSTSLAFADAIQDTARTRTWFNPGFSWTAGTAVSIRIPDTTPPELTSAAVAADGNSITVTFDESVDQTNLPAAGAFSVAADGAPVTVSGVSAGTAAQLVLALAAPGIRAGQVVTLGYTDPTDGDDTSAVQDTSGNDAVSFSDYSVTNNSIVVTVPSDWSLKPTGLAVGAKFRLLFLSSTKRDGSSSDIADYHAFIQTRAAAGHADIRTYSTGFRALGCTADTDARDTTYTTYTSTDKGVPIYWLNGAKAADQYEDFYDGTWDDEVNDKNESGTNGPNTSLEANYPLTGCNDRGTEYFDRFNRSSALAKIEVMVGRPNSSAAASHGPLSSNTALDVANTVTRPMYGLSAIFQVAADTTPPTLTSADVEDKRTDYLSRVLRGPAVVQPAPCLRLHSHCRRQCRHGLSVLCRGLLPQNAIWLRPPTAIRQGQAVVVTYTDPTAGNDSAAIQDTTGNDAADFTTGMNSVPAVINNSTVANAVLAGWSLTPTGLAVGDQFRLLFLSSTKRDATATDIATYNTFIQTRAAAGHTDIQAYSAGFRVVGCTAATDARDNTETTYTSTAKGVPIYWLNGAKAADQYEDFYDGSWDDEANDKNESGTDAHDTSQTANWPWTGCNHDGTEVAQFCWAVSRGLGTSDEVRYGRPDSSTVNHGPLSGLQNRAKTETRPLYGLSALFQVATTVVVNNPPAFSSSTAARSVAENTAAGQNVGAALTATDDDGHTLTYTLEGTDAASFDIASGSGQIQTKAGVTYNHEAQSTYTVIVKADDSNGGTDTVTVTITVTDVDEPPGQPAAPSVSATAGSTTSLDVTWTAPTNTGPAIASYDLQYRAGTSGSFTAGPQNVTGTSAAIASLMADTSYEVQVRATNAEGDGDWSVAGTGRTNNPPTVATAIPDQSATAGTAFSYAFPDTTFSDADTGDTLSYTATKTDDTALPTWLAFTASTRTFAGTPQAADAGTVAVKVTASDGNGGSVSDEFDITVIISVPSNWSLTPTGLAVGDQFRLLFLSSTKRNATATDIATYNTFIQTRAAAGHTDIRDYSAGFRAVGCTAAVDARDNTATTYTTSDKGVPIYWLNGAKAADQYEDFYDGSWDDEANDKNESGTNGLDTSLNDNWPLTGCSHDGTELTTFGASRALGASQVSVGRPNSSSSGHGPLFANSQVGAVFSRPMYGLSAVFQVAAAVVVPNNPPTGAPTITGTAQVGQTLTAGTTAIMDADGLTSVSYTYQWIRTAGGVDTNISGATASTYTLVAADLGTTIKVRVSFTDDASNAETLTSAATAVVSAAPNTPATGAPMITGTAQVGQTLTATVGTIADANGLPDPFLADANTSFQWVQVNLGTETNIASATASTYTLVREDWAASVRVKVAFQDAQGNSEGPLTSSSVIIVKPANTAATGKPGITGTAQVGQTLTATVGTSADVDGLPNPFLTDVNTSFQWIRVATDNTETNIASATASTYTLVTDDAGTTIKVKVGFADNYDYDEMLTSAATAVVSAAANTPATGAPTITGTAQVGQTLTAGTTAIMDADGLTTPSYTYQWIRVATDNSETNIASATASTYTLVAADLGTTVKVRVSFTDDASNDETLTSNVSVIIARPANTAATGKPGITGTAQVGQTLTATVGTSADVDGLPNPFLTDVNTSFQWIRVATDNTETNIASATASTYTLVDADLGTTIKVKVGFVDYYDYDETLTSAATAAVAASTNTPATGAPTITGTAQVGQTLTAVTTAIMDADGLTSVSYTYQWIRVDGGTETNISGATASTYTLVAADQGKTIKVRVSFTDDASNAETLTSTATAVVSAAPNTLPSASDGTVTTNEDTARTFAAADFNFLDTDPGDTLSNVRIVTLPASGKGTLALSGTPVTANQVVAATNIGTLTYTPPANANGTGYASFTFKVSDGTAESAADYTMTITVTAVNDAPTVATAIPDQPATAGTAFSYAFPANTFSDADIGDTLTYAATKADGATLPAWLSFAAGTRTFSGTPQAADIGTVAVKVTASDGNGGSVSDTFDITVSAAGDTTPPTLTSATVFEGGVFINLQFSENMLQSNLPSTDTFTVTAAGSAVTVYTVQPAVFPAAPPNAFWILVRPTIQQGQVVVVTYTDPTAGDDANAIQNTAGNDAATFTTGMDGVPAVTNNSITNTPATGAPTITGTATVGQTLTAVTTGIMDADGLTNVSYTYQWIRVDGTDADISGATSITYTLVGADLGKTIKVTVSFTDDASNPETLTSTATAAVAAAANTPATGAPAITGAAQVGQTLTAGTTAIMDANGLNSVNYTYQWIRVATDNTETNIASATASTYTLVAADQGTTIKVTVSFTDDASNAETLTSAATAAVAAAVPNNPPAFSADTAARSVAENTAAGQNVGGALTATDADSDTLTYTLEGADAASFDIVSGSGQIRTKAGVTYNHEAKSTYTVIVKADDGKAGTATVTVTITVTDVDEPPGRPAAPSVSATAGLTTSLDVTWTAPTNTGPDIANYDLHLPGERLGALYQRPAERDRHQRRHREPGRRHRLPGAGARHQRRGRRRLVVLGDRADHRRHRARRSDRPHGHGQRDHRDRPLLERPGEHRRLRHHRLQHRGLAQRHLRLDRPRRQHQQHRHDLRPHRACLRRHPPLPRLRHQHQRRRHRLQRRQRHHRSRRPCRRQQCGRGAGPPHHRLAASLLVRSRQRRLKPTLTGYDVRYRDDVNWTTVRQDAPSTTVIIADLRSSKFYDVQVRALNADGSGPWSSTAEAVTSPRAERVYANHPLIPADLGPGDSFRLLFITSGTKAATPHGHSYLPQLR